MKRGAATAQTHVRGPAALRVFAGRVHRAEVLELLEPVSDEDHFCVGRGLAFLHLYRQKGLPT
jgi:hypothetical protein